MFLYDQRVIQFVSLFKTTLFLCLFQYMLFMAKGKEDVGKLEKFVMFQRGSGSITYKASVPVKGLFKLDIFGKDSRRHKSLDLICSYLIDSTSGGAKVYHSLIR